MDWLLGKREKSVARNAQLAVKNMHSLMEKQSSKIRELEGLVIGLQHLSTESLENEINRLENKKIELTQELEKVDKSLSDKKLKLEETKSLVKNVMKNINEKHKNSMIKLNSSNNDKLNNSSSNLKLGNTSESRIKELEKRSSFGLIEGGADGDYLEAEYIDEIEMLATIREVVNPTSLLFITHRSNSDDIIVYTPSPQLSEIITAFKLTQFNDKSSSTSLNSFDFILGLGTKIIPNHERDIPEVLELSIPCTYEGSAPDNAVGQLIGAVEITLAQDVVIDIWKTVDNFYWATTSVNGVQFSVLERIFVTCDINWGVPSVSQIDLFARHPTQRHMIVESISSGNE